MNDKFLLVFLDGFGLAPAGRSNPLSLYSMPGFLSISGTRFVLGGERASGELLLKGIDASLGVDGIPQSATGQTSLLTGINAQEIMGFHMPAFPGEKLKKIITEHNILKKVKDLGLSSTFANAYSEKYFRLVVELKRRHSVTTLSVLASGLPFRMLDDLAGGEAVSWDITGRYLKEFHLPDTPIVEPKEAGNRLARIAGSNSFTLFECFMPDVIGHRMDMKGAEQFIPVLDQMLAGIMEEKDKSITFILSSDHGNIEDLSKKPHTTNPVPLLVVGKHAAAFADAENITDITPRILGILKRGRQSPIKI